MWKNILMSVMIITVTGAAMTASTLAAFTAKATVSGVSFSTGHAGLQLVANLADTTSDENLTTTLPGTEFAEIGPNWSQKYDLKFKNTGSVDLVTQLNVSTTPDSDDIASHILVEAYKWDDTNADGQSDDADTYTLLAGEQSLASVLTSPVALGQVNGEEVLGLQLRFKTGDLPSSTQNQSATLDFIIQGTTEGVVQEL